VRSDLLGELRLLPDELRLEICPELLGVLLLHQVNVRQHLQDLR